MRGGIRLLCSAGRAVIRPFFSSLVLRQDQLGASLNLLRSNMLK
jgi:hypothetical protein